MLIAPPEVVKPLRPQVKLSDFLVVEEALRFTFEPVLAHRKHIPSVTRGERLMGVLRDQEDARAFGVDQVEAVKDPSDQLRRGGGGGVGGGIRRRASDAVGSMDTTPEDAINTVYENASVAVRKMVEQNVSLLLIDYEVDGDDQVTELILLRAQDLDDDTKLLVSFRAPNRMGGGFRMRDIGKARIKSLDSKYAYAEITDNRDEITEALNRDPFAVVVRPGND